MILTGDDVMNRIIKTVLMAVTLFGCESISPLYKPSDDSINVGNGNIILKIDTQNRMGQFLDNRLYRLLQKVSSPCKLIVNVHLDNGKYSEVRFVDGTVGRIIDNYVADLKVISGETHETLAEEVISVSASKNYSSSKVQIMEATSAAIDQGMLEELAEKIFNYLKVKIDNKDFIRKK